MVLENVATVAGTGGNTKPQSSKGEKRIRSRKWCFTLNNYTTMEEEELNVAMSQKNYSYIYGFEIGDEGTPHLQGYIEHKHDIEFNTLKKMMPRAHIEKAKGTKQQNIDYCSKSGKYKTNFEMPEKLDDPLDGFELKPFQKTILDVLKNKPSKRIIYWIWESEGNVGKSSVAKHICIHNKDALVLNGKQNDMFNAILQYNIKKKGLFPKIILIDIPRSSMDYVSWSAIEKIKDGFFYSGKYEGGMVIMNSPHVICMANSPPPNDKMSNDRWCVMDINIELKEKDNGMF